MFSPIELGVHCRIFLIAKHLREKIHKCSWSKSQNAYRSLV